MKNRQFEIRESDFNLSNLFLNIYGRKVFNCFKNKHTPQIAKEHFLKLLKSFRFSINETIKIADKDQLTALYIIIEEGEKELIKSKSFNDIDQAFITTQTKLIFQLIGNIPKTSDAEDRINRKGTWELNGLRQIQYVQNNSNRELLMFKIIKEHNIFSSWGAFVHFYNSTLNNDAEKLFQYLITNHPEKCKNLL